MHISQSTSPMDSMALNGSFIILAVISFLLLLHCSLADSSVLSPNVNQDMQVLLSFKSQTSQDNEFRALASWNDTSPDLCRWPGVTCGGRRRPDRVVALSLVSSGLSGALPPCLANLTFLRSLNLYGNQFDGQIPPELGHFAWLKLLNLSNNGLQGAIPDSLGNISSLALLDLSSNSLSGAISPGLRKLTSLVVLNLNQNSLSGDIPACLGNLSSLTVLDASMNSLSGGIPPSLGRLLRLKSLILSFNDLSGEIPSSVWNMSSLNAFQVGGNLLSGQLPSDAFARLPNLQRLELFNNSFHGPIPASLINSSSLAEVQLELNHFRGSIPANLGTLKGLSILILFQNQLEAGDWSFISDLTNCTSLMHLHLDDNNLRGELPASICNLTAGIQIIAMGGNQISGSIPEGIGSLVGLTRLELGPNLLTGTIPTSIGMLDNLQGLDLTNNALSGQVPSILGNLTQISRICLGMNNLDGTIPSNLGNCKRLELLSLRHNKITGSIPEQILSISSLSRGLVLSNNMLTGSLSERVGSLINLNFLSLSWNNLSGEIPAGLGNCRALVLLDMQGNSFSGAIPSSVSALRGIQELDLSRNNLSGHIPKFLEDFPNLYYLNLSFNELEGEVPQKGVFGNVTGFSFVQNKQLCGGIPQLRLSPCLSQAHHEKKYTLPVIIVSSVIVVSLFAACWMTRSRRKEISPIISVNGEQVKLSYGDLIKSTNGFSSVNLIGKGSFGSVYKGTIVDGGERKTVAIKVLDLQQQGALKSFVAECETLRNTRHRNLLKILTSCSSIDFKGNDFKALVFEFMPNGSLDDWLHPKRRDQESQPMNLSLIQRLDILIDVASALDYLHHHNHSQIPIIHCDLKPSNVLLDDDMNARVADFGLARFLIEATAMSSQKVSDSLSLKGSIGYVAPEYGMANRISTQGDVYSYGILVLEMFTGRRPTSSISEGSERNLSLREYVEIAFPDKIITIVDSRMLPIEIDQSGRERIQECITSVLQIGLMCSKELPMQRITMEDVAREMLRIKQVFLNDRRARYI